MTKKRTVSFTIKYDSKKDSFYVRTALLKKSVVLGSWNTLEREIRNLFEDKEVSVVIKYSSDAQDRIHYRGKYRHLKNS